MDQKQLLKAGFKHSDELRSAHQDAAAANNMSHNGQYDVNGVFTKGLVTLVFEQNTCPEPLEGGLDVTITHPPVCIVSGPKGKATCRADDTELILAVADSLS